MKTQAANTAPRQTLFRRATSRPAAAQMIKPKTVGAMNFSGKRIAFPPGRKRIRRQRNPFDPRATRKVMAATIA